MDVTEHPEKYSEDEIRELLEEPEIRELYAAMCDADSALKPAPRLTDKDVDREWQRFKRQNPTAERHILRIFGRRVAAVSAIAVTSLAALAVGVGVVVDRYVVKQDRTAVEDTVDMPVAQADPYVNDTIVESVDSLAVTNPMIYENESLGVILRDMTEFYGLKLATGNGALLNLRLFYRWDRGAGMEEAIRQLNNFEKINLELSDSTLTLK